MTVQIANSTRYVLSANDNVIIKQYKTGQWGQRPSKNVLYLMARHARIYPIERSGPFSKIVGDGQRLSSP